MSQTIILKHSTVKDKLPSSAQYGEVFVNYHSENPFLATLNNQGQFEKFLSETKTRGLIQDAKEDIDNSFYTKEEINNMFEAFDPSGEVDFDNYYTKRETDNLLAGKSDSAHTHDYSQILNTPDLSNFATLSDIPSINGLASEVWVGENYQPKGNYLTEHQSLENYYTKSEADNKFLTSHQDLSDYALKSEIPDVSNFVTSAFTDATYVKKGEAPTDVYTKSESDSKFQPQSGMTDYALKSELPSTTGLASEEWVSNNFSSTAHTHSDLATKAELENYLTIVSASTTYATKSEIPDISDLATKSEIPDTSNFITSAFTESQYQAKGTYVVPSDLDDYALKSELPTVPDVSDFITSAFTEEHYAQVNHTHSQYAEKSEIPDTSNFITSAFTEEHYMKIGSTPTDVYTKVESDSKFQSQSGMTDYALKSEIPSTTGLASETWVSQNFSTTAHTHDYETLTNKPDLSIYLTEHQDISNLATKAELENYQPQSGMTDYALKSEIPDVSNFVTSAFTEATYAKKGEVPSDAYTKAETDILLAGKANSAHTHTMSEITDLDVPKTWRGTLAQYNNLTEIDNDTLYIITDSSEQLVTSGDVESMISGFTNLTEVQTLLEGYSQTGHTHSYNDLTDKPTIPSTTGLASETWVSNNFSTTAHTHSEYAEKTDLANYMPNSGMTDYALKSEIPNSYTKTEADNLLAGKANSAHTHTVSDITDLNIPSVEGLASEAWVSQNFQPQSAMTEYSLSGHTHSQYLTETSADTRYARVVSLTQAQYDALVQNDQVEQGVLYCIIEQSNS